MKKVANMVGVVLSLFLLVGLYSGAFAQDTMATALRSGTNCSVNCADDSCGCIPLADPYCAGTTDVSGVSAECSLSAPASLLDVCNLPSSLPGETATTVSQVVVTEIPLDVVDWVMVELRSSTVPLIGDSVVAKKAGLLLNNGRIVDAKAYTVSVNATGRGAGDCLPVSSTNTASNCPDLSFNPVTDFVKGFSLQQDTELFVAIRHRNHLPILSSGPMSRSGGIYYWDFTTSTTIGRPEFPSNGKRQTDFENRPKATRPSVFALYGGNVDRDGSIRDVEDASLVGAADGCAGYYAQDVDMNGIVAISGDDRRSNVSRASVRAGSAGLGNVGASRNVSLEFP